LDWPAASGVPHLAVPEGVPLVVTPHQHDEILAVGGLLSMLGEAEVVAVTGDGAETVEALDRLGVRAPVVHRLGQPAGRIDERAVVRTLDGLLTPGRWCLSTWRGDGHPDHEAAGWAAEAACVKRGATLVEFPIWAWRWARPDDYRLPWRRARRVDLTRAARAAKADAVDVFRDRQHPAMLARFARPFEILFA
jgi:LmbE family N-acetylglucosaminyl deacetylase